MKIKQKRLLPVILLALVLALLLPPFSPARLAVEQALGLSPQTVKIKDWQRNGTYIQLFDLKGPNYRGKMMLVKVKDSKKIQAALARGGLGALETTSSMAKRTGAKAAVNGGGFYNNPKYNRPMFYPIYITIHDGRLVSYVRPVTSTVAIGITGSGKLVVDGSSPPAQLIKAGVKECVSFTPLLVKDGKAVPVRKLQPDPRTAIGQRKDGTFIFVVIDGRRKGWSEGVTFQELQKIFLQQKAWIAANLDGGGSSTMVFDGKVLNRPSDVTGERPVATSLVIYP